MIYNQTFNGQMAQIINNAKRWTSAYGVNLSEMLCV